MDEVMEVECKEKCQCCKAGCTSCSEFQKIVDLKGAGLVVYRYTKRKDEINKITGKMDSSIKTTDDVFIIHNTKDIYIKTDECITEIGDEISCPRCRELVQRAQRYLKNIPSIDKKDVISVCDHCKIKKRSIKYCCECHEVVKKFLVEKEKKSREKETVKEQIKTWLSKIRKLLLKNVVDDKLKRLKYRAHSELYINKLCKDEINSSRRLEVGPILEVGVKITERTRLIEKVATKSESALKSVDYKKTKFKSTLVENNSSIEIKKYASSSLETYNTSLDKDIDINKEDLDRESFEYLRQKRVREFAPKTAFKHHRSLRTLKKYYSDEKIYFSADGFENLENIKRNFSYVFPKVESEVNRPLRRVKTSAELIEDTQDRLRLRAKLINDEINRQEAKRRQITNRNKEKQISAKITDQLEIKLNKIVKEYDEDLEKPSSKEAKSEDKEIKTDKDKVQKDKSKRPSSKKVTAEDSKTKSDTIPKDIKEKPFSKKTKTEYNIQIDKNKIQKDKSERPLSKMAATEDKSIKSGKDNLLKEKPIGTKAKTDDKEIKSDKYKTIKDKSDRPLSKKATTEEKNIKSDKDEIYRDKKVPQQVVKNLKGKTDQIKEEKEKDIDGKQIVKKEKKEQQGKENKDIVNKEKLRKETEIIDKVTKGDFRKEKENREEFQREKEKPNKENNEEIPKDKSKKEKEKKDELQKVKELKDKENKIHQALKDEEKKSKEERIKNQDEKLPKVDDKTADTFRKMIEEQAKLKAEALKMKKQQEEENRKLRMEAEKKTKETEPKLNVVKEHKVEKKLEKEEPKLETKQEQPTIKELDIRQIKIRKPSTDDLILRLVRLKQATKRIERPKRLSQINITPLMVKEHKVHKARKILNCAICVNSDVELDVENIINDKSKPDEVTDLIVGNKIIKSKHPLYGTPVELEMPPVLYKSLFKDDIAPKQLKEIAEKMTDRIDVKPPTLITQKYAEPEPAKGVIRYALSDRSFIDKGWTMLPTEKVVRKMNVYRMRPAHPEFDWFVRNKNKRLMLYDSGEKLAEFDDNGRGRWFYRNGKLALDYYDAEEMNAQQRFVIYGSGEPDERGRYQPISILATFDYLGNGVVFDHAGKIRLKYNQTEGVVLDRGIGPVSHWKWHTLNDPPVLQQVMIDTQMAHKDPEILKLSGPGDDKGRPDNEEMLAIEFDNFIKEKSRKLTQKFKPFQIRTKALKINENFSLKVLDQANIYLIFRDGTTNIKINIGMILDHQEIVDTDTAEVGEVSNNLERFPARTDSLAGLQRSVAYAQRVERLRIERERRLKHPEKALSVDQLVAATSRPPRSQIKIVPSGSTATKDKCYCKCRKPSSSNVYYDTRLV